VRFRQNRGSSGTDLGSWSRLLEAYTKLEATGQKNASPSPRQGSTGSFPVSRAEKGGRTARRCVGLQAGGSIVISVNAGKPRCEGYPLSIKRKAFSAIRREVRRRPCVAVMSGIRSPSSADLHRGRTIWEHLLHWTLPGREPEENETGKRAMFSPAISMHRGVRGSVARNPKSGVRRKGLQSPSSYFGSATKQCSTEWQDTNSLGKSAWTAISRGTRTAGRPSGWPRRMNRMGMKHRWLSLTLPRTRLGFVHAPRTPLGASEIAGEDIGLFFLGLVLFQALDA